MRLLYGLPDVVCEHPLQSRATHVNFMEQEPPLRGKSLLGGLLSKFSAKSQKKKQYEVGDGLDGREGLVLGCDAPQNSGVPAFMDAADYPAFNATTLQTSQDNVQQPAAAAVIMPFLLEGRAESLPRLQERLAAMVLSNAFSDAPGSAASTRYTGDSSQLFSGQYQAGGQLELPSRVVVASGSVQRGDIYSLPSLPSAAGAAPPSASIDAAAAAAAAGVNLTAAALGTHARLQEATLKQTRSRKKHTFVNQWLQDAASLEHQSDGHSASSLTPADGQTSESSSQSIRIDGAIPAAEVILKAAASARDSARAPGWRHPSSLGFCDVPQQLLPITEQSPAPQPLSFIQPTIETSLSSQDQKASCLSAVEYSVTSPTTAAPGNRSVLGPSTSLGAALPTKQLQSLEAKVNSRSYEFSNQHHPSSTGNLKASGDIKTKTIAVATHCPEDIIAQQWRVDDFRLLKKLYEGNLSVVCQAQHKQSGRHVALKIYKRSRLHEMERFQLAREICLHVRVLHPNIVSLFAAWKDSKYVYLALEWAPQGNLFDLLVSRGGRLSEEEAAVVVVQPLLSALAALHSQSLIHRDIKLENILLDAAGNIKLADFGLAIDQKFEQANTRLGTFGYFAPEVLDCPLKKGPFDFKDQSLPGYDCKVDVWSAGVVAYEVLTGKAPFSASSPNKIVEAIRHRVLEYPPTLSTEAADYLNQALTRDPKLRPSAEVLLAHPWIQKWAARGA